MAIDIPIHVVQYGIGPIGLECLRAVLAKEDTGLLKLVGAIDIDPAKTGRDAAELLHLDKPTGVVVRGEAATVLRETQPDVVLHTTSSFLDRVQEQLAECVRAGVSVVSSTEELSFPYDRYPQLSAELDALACEHAVTVVGTGVNPGYAMDTLALAATGVCTEVTEVRATRVVDAGKRRLPLQHKVGAGLTVAEFEERKATGTFGHIGLRESLLFVARGLRWTLDRVDERLHPMIADEPVDTPYIHVDAGRVAGIHHTVTAYVGGEPSVSLDLKMYVGAREPHDAVRIVGSPPVDLEIRNGIFGDTATVATLINAIPLVLEARPGLKTMMDLPVPRAFATKLVLKKQAEAA